MVVWEKNYLGELQSKEYNVISMKRKVGPKEITLMIWILRRIAMPCSSLPNSQDIFSALNKRYTIRKSKSWWEVPSLSWVGACTNYAKWLIEQQDSRIKTQGIQNIGGIVPVLCYPCQLSCQGGQPFVMRIIVWYKESGDTSTVFVLMIALKVNLPFVKI